MKDEEIRVEVDWKPTAGEPSAAWRRLWDKLLASRKEKPTGTRQDDTEGRCKDGKNGRTVPD